MNEQKKAMLMRVRETLIDLKLDTFAQEVENTFPKYFKEDKPKTLTKVIEKYEGRWGVMSMAALLTELKEVTEI